VCPHLTLQLKFLKTALAIAAFFPAVAAQPLLFFASSTNTTVANQ